MQVNNQLSRLNSPQFSSNFEKVSNRLKDVATGALEALKNHLKTTQPSLVILGIQKYYPTLIYRFSDYNLGIGATIFLFIESIDLIDNYKKLKNEKRLIESIQEIAFIFVFFNASIQVYYPNIVFHTASKISCNADLIAILGHSDPISTILGPNYEFSATQIEVRAIERNIAENGDFLFWGCSTAGEFLKDIVPIARFLSICIPNIRVTGFSDVLHPYFTWIWFDGRIGICGWGRESFENITRYFINGEIVSLS